MVLEDLPTKLGHFWVSVTMEHRNMEDLATKNITIPVENSGTTTQKIRRYPLVICYIAIENDHKTSGFSHEKWWIFP